MEHPQHEKKCPSCGSKNLEVRHETRQLSLPFTLPMKYDAVIDFCKDCEMEGDFLGINEKNLPALIEKAKKDSAALMIGDLVEKQNFTMSYMERALDLPMRTMMRWKSGDISAAALTLLRMVETYPWMVEVADAQFDRVYATKRLAKEGMAAMFNFAEMNNWESCMTINRNEDAQGKHVNAHIELSHTSWVNSPNTYSNERNFLGIAGATQ